MANYLMALRYSQPFLPGLEEKYEPDIVKPPEVENGSYESSSGQGLQYFEPVYTLLGEAGRRILKTRAFERKKRMAHTAVIYVRRHTNKAQLEKQYRTQLQNALLKSDVILIEPASVCRSVSRTIKFGFYFFFLCLGLSVGSLFLGRCYKHKTYLSTSLFISGSLLTLFYANSYETWNIADFTLLPDPLLCGVYCSPAVIFKTENPVVLFRNYDRLDRIQLLFIVATAAGLQMLYRFYTGPPPYLCPCTSRQFPEFPRYASFLLLPCITGAVNMFKAKK